ncbi:hypothetical protein [Amycolatopsis sp. NPDC004625]|uniref:HD domain-containing protein n=1 Tax=Amycolatopsis sp. NPDC004625 TaxID=3154670 RepID=UPI0033A5EE1E
MPLGREGETHNVIRDSVVFGSVVQARDVGAVSAAPDGWAGRVFGSSLWEHAGPEADFYRARVCAAAALVQAEVTALLPRLADDPWLDAGFATRFLERIEWLWSPEGPELCASEAALLTLLPFLRQANLVRLAAAHVVLNPAQLGRDAPDTAAARSFEAFLDGHEVLVHRARLRPDAEPSIGWWLFHRWLARHDSFADAGLFGAAAAPLAELGETFAVERVSALLEGLRLGPDVCHPEFLGGLPSEDHVRAPGRQRVRDQRLALTTALAATLAIEATALPDVVGEHLGIPVPVDPPTVLACLEEAVWGGPHDLPALRARCPHEAVVEGLREHTANADELLHGVRRLVRERIPHPMPELPTRLSADGVAPASGVFDSWARFRLDQHRMRDLLMGVQLYKDPDLAVRELYQNALDACRYRAARTEYLDRTQPAAYSYTGGISFVQGVEDGRAYLECRDNGIGMGESELRGVFSNAGGRFPGQAEFRHERAAWEELDPPIPFHPNSRFGIGVFSYFMLADEIRVTTCRMGLDGRPGPLLEVGIHGPAHLFRIVRVAERGEEPGTTVRLYLNSDRPWSCVEVLRRLLAVAEFETTAQGGGEPVTWLPGKLELRTASAGERFGLEVSGKVVEWRGAPDGCQVFWCEQGGAVLVDGLIVHPAQRRGVCAGPGTTVHGAVINLFGSRAPARISVDRTEIIDDVSEPLEKLLAAAAAELAGSENALLSYAWICEVASWSPIIADLLTKACIGAGRKLAFGNRWVDVARVGCLRADLDLLATAGVGFLNGAPSEEAKVIGRAPDHVLLWRLLAHRPNPTLDQLTTFCPELATFDDLRPAMPSDQVLLAEFAKGALKYNTWRNESAAIDAVVDDVAAVLGWTAREAKKRAIEFYAEVESQRDPGDGPWEWPRFQVPLQLDRAALLDEYSEEVDLPAGPVLYSQVFQLAQQHGLHVNVVVTHLRRLGLDVRLHVPDQPTDLEETLFRASGCWSFSVDEAMPLAYVLVAADRLRVPLPELEKLVRSYGVEVSFSGLPPGLTFDSALDLLTWRGLDDAFLERRIPPRLQVLIETAHKKGTSLTQLVEWRQALGIQVSDLGEILRAALARVPASPR